MAKLSLVLVSWYQKCSVSCSLHMPSLNHLGKALSAV